MLTTIGKCINKPKSILLIIVPLSVLISCATVWSFESHTDTGYSYYLSGNIEKAMEELKQSISLNPRDAFAHLILGFCYLEKGNTDQMKLEFNQAFELGEKDPRVHVFMAKYYEYAGDIEKAIRSYHVAISISPKDPKPYLKLATIYAKYKGEIGKAKKLLEICLDLNLSNNEKIDAYLLLADFTQDIEEQKELIERILVIDPNNPTAKTQLRFYAMGEEFKRNKTISSKAEYHFGKAEHHFGKYEFEEAIEEYKKVIEEEPKFAKSYLYIGDCYFQMKQYRNAVTYFKKAIETDPMNPQARAFLGDAYSRLGDYNLACESYSKAVQLDPKYYNAVDKLRNTKKFLKNYTKRADVKLNCFR